MLLSRESIPGKVYDELCKVAVEGDSSVSFSQYGDVPAPGCVTLVLEHEDVIEENEMMNYRNPETFECEKRLCDLVQMYRIRCLMDDEHEILYVYGIYSTPIQRPVI